MTKKGPARDGFRTVTPYLTVEGASQLLEFLQSVFGAEVLEVSERPDGKIGNAVVKIGDSLVEVAEKTDQWGSKTAGIHLYVDDTDGAYERAIAGGAKSLYEPADMPYGERSGGVEDPAGNYWYIATHTGAGTSG